MVTLGKYEYLVDIFFHRCAACRFNALPTVEKVILEIRPIVVCVFVRVCYIYGYSSATRARLALLGPLYLASSAKYEVRETAFARFVYVGCLFRNKMLQKS